MGLFLTGLSEIGRELQSRGSFIIFIIFVVVFVVVVVVVVVGGGEVVLDVDVFSLLFFLFVEILFISCYMPKATYCRR